MVFSGLDTGDSRWYDHGFGHLLAIIMLWDKPDSADGYEIIKGQP